MNTALENKLNALKIPGRVASVSDNDFYTCYHIIFNPDITINRIKARCEDLELFFAGSAVDIETDAGDVVIKVTKNNRHVIGLYDFTCNIDNLTDYEIPLIIGQKENGQKLFFDLVNAPHILAGGSTGSGKSVFMHNLIISTLCTGKTALILIDVKRVEFSIYENMPQLAAPISYDARAAFQTLKNLNYEMEKRYKLLKDNHCRTIKEYRKNIGRLDYIAVFIDELADLILSNKKIELELIKLAQLGRAAGIHLIVATQRPDASIISGLIRSNIPTRVCFAVQKSTDSRIIIDTNGGENLRGNGDGLFVPIGSKTPVRFQAPYITTRALLETIEKAKQ